MYIRHSIYIIYHLIASRIPPGLEFWSKGGDYSFPAGVHSDKNIYFPLRHKPRPGGMREAIKYGGPPACRVALAVLDWHR